MFGIDQQVYWTSSSNGCEKTKSGRVEAIIQANQYPTTIQREEADAWGIPRNHVSYMVRVHGKSGKGKGKLYWPRVSALKSGVTPDASKDK